MKSELRDPWSASPEDCSGGSSAAEKRKLLGVSWSGLEVILHGGYRSWTRSELGGAETLYCAMDHSLREKGWLKQPV